MFAFNTTETSSWAKGPNGSINDADRAVAKKVHSCWIGFFKMDPKAKSLTCADGVAWPAYTDAGDDAMQFTATPKVVKSKTIPNGPPGAQQPAAANATGPAN
jgi:carboxylesterase type B